MALVLAPARCVPPRACELRSLGGAGLSAPSPSRRSLSLPPPVLFYFPPSAVGAPATRQLSAASSLFSVPVCRLIPSPPAQAPVGSSAPSLPPSGRPCRHPSLCSVSGRARRSSSTGLSFKRSLGQTGRAERSLVPSVCHLRFCGCELECVCARVCACLCMCVCVCL